MNQLIDKCLPYFMIGFNFQEICIDNETCWSVNDSTYQLFGPRSMVALV